MIRNIQRVAWLVMVAGVLLAASNIGGLGAYSPAVPSSVAAYDTHHRSVVIGFTLVVAATVVLAVGELLRSAGKKKS